MNAFFDENKNANGYFAILDVEGNAKIVQAVVSAARKLGKAAYIFSVDKEGGKVVHANFVPEAYRKPEFNAKTWAAAVSDIIGGKVCSSHLFNSFLFPLSLSLVPG